MDGDQPNMGVEPAALMVPEPDLLSQSDGNSGIQAHLSATEQEFLGGAGAQGTGRPDSPVEAAETKGPLNTHMNEQLSDEASTVQKLQARIQELEQQLTSCQAELQATDSQFKELSTRNQELLALGGPTLTTVWHDLCSGKASATPLVVSFADGDVSNRSEGADVGPGSNPNIIIEHLSVSGAKAKLAQQQLLAMGSQSFHMPPGGALPSPATAPRPGRTLERQVSLGGPSGIPIHTTSRRTVRRVDAASAAGALGPADSIDTGLSSPHTRPDLLPSCEDDEGDDSRLLDIDDLLGEASAGPEGVTPLYDQHSSAAQLFEDACIQVDSLFEFQSTACGSDLPLPALMDGASQTAGSTLVDAQCQSEASVEAASQDAAVQVIQELPDVACVGSQSEAVDVQHASVQADPGELSLDATTQTEGDDDSAADVSVQATVTLLHTATSVSDLLPGEDEAASKVAPEEPNPRQLLEAAQGELGLARQEAAAHQVALAAAQADLEHARQQQADALQQVQTLTVQVEELSAHQQAAAITREVEVCTDQEEAPAPVALQLLVRSGSMETKLVQLEQQVASHSQEAEAARQAAADGEQALKVARAQLLEAQDALTAALSKVTALQEAETKMQRELEAYEHTLDGLRVAVEEADADKQLKEAQNLELAQKLALVTEFVNFKSKNPKIAVMDFPTWMAKQQKTSQGKENKAVVADA